MNAWHPHPDWLGPVGLVAVTWPDDGSAAGGVAELLDLVEHHQLRLLDVEAVTARDGAPVTVPLDGLPGLGELSGADAGLLDDHDRAEVAAGLVDGETALVVVYEVLTLHPVIDTWLDAGLSVLADVAVDPEDLAAAVEVAS